jgi:protein AroM
VKQVHVLLYSRYSDRSAEFVKDNLETSAELSVSGALDGLSDEELMLMVADPIATGVPVELKDGSWIYVAHDLIDQRARGVIEALREQGTETVMMCCTIPWHSLEDLPDVICPSRVLEANAVALLPKGSALGIVQPDANTKDEEIKHWRDLGVPVVAATISPHDNSVDELVESAMSLVEQGAGVIVLDCLAFAREHWQAVRQETGKPVLLPVSLLGKVLDEAYG